jgi:hypothetical protein
MVGQRHRGISEDNAANSVGSLWLMWMVLGGTVNMS